MYISPYFVPVGGVSLIALAWAYNEHQSSHDAITRVAKCIANLSEAALNDRTMEVE